MANGTVHSIEGLLDRRIKWHTYDISAGGSAGTKTINVNASDVLFLFGTYRSGNSGTPGSCYYNRVGWDSSNVNVTTSGGKIAFSFG